MKACEENSKVVISAGGRRMADYEEIRPVGTPAGPWGHGINPNMRAPVMINSRELGRPMAARAWPLVARMKRSEIRDHGDAAAHPRHPRHAGRLRRFNAEQTPDPGFRDAASGLRQVIPSFHEAGWNAVKPGIHEV